MKKDIETIEDVKIMVNHFYDDVVANKTIGYLFNDVAKVNWEKHLPVMYSFWEQIIFNTGDFKGNPILAHQKLHEIAPLNNEHFTEWLRLFHKTVDDLFEGLNATLAKQRAESIATVMKIKVLYGGIHNKNDQ